MALKTIFFRNVEVSAFVYATEDTKKVKRALLKILNKNSANFRIKSLHGYYKDPINLITLDIKDQESILGLFHSILKSLSPLDQEKLIDELKLRVDKAGNLYLRFDKQRAAKGQVSLNEVDPIRVKFKFKIPHKADSISFIKSAIDDVLGGLIQAQDRML